MTQAQLAQAAGVGRSAVQYWERLPGMDPTAWAVSRMAGALGWVLPARMQRNNARAREWGDRARWEVEAAMQAAAAFAAWKERESARAARRRVICGAMTRKGTSCRMKSEPGKRRCKFHGGKSTGARTPEGIERIREAQRRRWAKARGQSVAAFTGKQSPDPAATHDLEDGSHART